MPFIPPHVHTCTVPEQRMRHPSLSPLFVRQLNAMLSDSPPAPPTHTRQLPPTPSGP